MNMLLDLPPPPLHPSFSHPHSPRHFVCCLIWEFRESGFDRCHFNDDDHCDRPVSAATQENAARVKELIREDALITCKDLQDILGIGMSALNEILHHQLHYWISPLLLSTLPPHIPTPPPRHFVCCGLMRVCFGAEIVSRERLRFVVIVFVMFHFSSLMTF